MLKTNEAVAWVVYRKTMSLTGKSPGLISVCQQGEWDEMELANPGYHTLVRAGIPNEPEAEALARDMSGYVEPKRNSQYARRT